MSRREERERKIEEWLEHLQNWKTSGKSLSAYARTHGLALWSVYHWRKILRREGRWTGSPDEQGEARKDVGASERARVPLRFARVKLDERVGRSSLTVHVILRNGRRAQIELNDASSLAGVLDALEGCA